MASSMYTLSDFEKELMELATGFEKGKEAKKFLNKQGTKLNRTVKKSYKANTEEKNEKLEKSFKKGKVFKDYKKQFAVRSYNSHPLAHLVNDGHIHKGGKLKDGVETFVKGNDFLGKAKKDFEPVYYSEASKWIDEMIKKGL